ncbi:precorrin-6A synthase (deacetylating) [Luteococcus peritonei]|uniref:Precorrin-6A synthase (Deacetylating) n=1 Tax=Luteococcus peritonei TaxID=88874 RepID=A0ABW4RTI4_9ACTN
MTPELHATAPALRVLGIGMGPQHVTPEVSAALRECDQVVALDKSAAPGAHAGREADEQLAVRRLVAEQHGVELVVVPDPPRDRDPSDYLAAVADWHRARVERIAAALRERGGRTALLAWGDPSLYDSMVRLAEQLAGQLGVDWDVMPGISAPQLLAARHRIVLHRVGEPVHLTSARRLREAVEGGQRNVVVMLGSERTLDELAGLADWQIWWAANLGCDGERLVAGRIDEVLDQVRQARRAALEQDGWVMDIALVRAPDESALPASPEESAAPGGTRESAEQPVAEASVPRTHPAPGTLGASAPEERR